ncbi:basic salivary proline-rich protein 2-like [Molothrus aeneus]|uniref:basic salivary proline-rich protein 2-like n=1 Tax=Molothrus aeneus TaxID=84833 RepID=UPI00345B49FB
MLSQGGHRASPTAYEKEPAPCRYSGSLHKNLPPARHFQAGSARPQRGWTGEAGEPPSASARGRAQAPQQGRSGQGRPQRELRTPFLGLTVTPPPPAGDTTEPPAPGRPRSPGGGEKERSRGGRRPEERRWAPGRRERSGGGESRAAPASPVPAGPARLRPRRSRLCRVQLPPGPPAGPRAPTNQRQAPPAPPTNQQKERVPAQRHWPPGRAYPPSRQAYPVTREGAVPAARRPMRNHSASRRSQSAAAWRGSSDRAGGGNGGGWAVLSRDRPLSGSPSAPEGSRSLTEPSVPRCQAAPREQPRGIGAARPPPVPRPVQGGAGSLPPGQASRSTEAP